MITVRIGRHADGSVAELRISGHAYSGEPGHDLVCAAVSGISFGMFNAIEMVLKVELPVQMGKGGFLHCKVPQEYTEGLQEKVQLMLEGMVASLCSVAMEHDKYVKVIDTKTY
jgi:uncharacterized protein YsxB (DUF464 family)